MPGQERVITADLPVPLLIQAASNQRLFPALEKQELISPQDDSTQVEATCEQCPPMKEARSEES